jgi:hypothetical protein
MVQDRGLTLNHESWIYVGSHTLTYYGVFHVKRSCNI